MCVCLCGTHTMCSTCTCIPTHIYMCIYMQIYVKFLYNVCTMFCIFVFKGAVFNAVVVFVFCFVCGKSADLRVPLTEFK